LVIDASRTSSSSVFSVSLVYTTVPYEWIVTTAVRREPRTMTVPRIEETNPRIARAQNALFKSYPPGLSQCSPNVKR